MPPFNIIGIIWMSCIAVTSQQVLTYEELIHQHEALRKELSDLKTKLQIYTEKCTCPTEEEKECIYSGRRYRYKQMWDIGECQVCTCLLNGEVSCRFEEGRPLCSDKCISNPCYNGGTCVPQNSTFKCVCPDGCVGRQCEIREELPCALSFDEGYECETDTPSMVWYFDPLRGICTNAEYLGCGGNRNKFNSKESCDSACATGACCMRTQIRDDILYGHSLTGFDRYGFKDGKDNQNHPATIKTATAFGEMRFRYNGVDFKGYRKDGYNRDRYFRSGYDCQGVDSKGLNMDGLSSGFNYTCQIMSLLECREKTYSKSSNSEVLSFTPGKAVCEDTICNPYSNGRCVGCRYHGKSYRYEEKFRSGCNQCICTRMGSVQCTCSNTVKRKEIRDMTASEVERYQRAVRKLYKSGQWFALSEMYAKYLPHSHSAESYFLPWIRAMLHHIELELQTTSGSCDLSIPYFDWTMDIGNMEKSPIWRAGLFGGDGAGDGSCVGYHPVSEYPWFPCLKRKFNKSISLPDLVVVEKVLRSKSQKEISNQLQTSSILFRMFVGGHASSMHSIYDPIVVSHYAFIDKLWHHWQVKASNYMLLDASTRYKPLEPFGVTNDDVISSPSQLCVEYARLGSLCSSDLGDGKGRPYNLVTEKSFDSDGFDSAGYDRLGYNREGFNGDGFDRHGYDKEGYDRYGFNRNGVTPYGVTRTGDITNIYDRTVFDKQNFTVLGVDYRGFDFSGRDIFGYDVRGFDKDGCNAHYQDGYHYLKQKYEVEIKLSEMNQEQLEKIERLCSTLGQPPSAFMIMSWVVIDPTHTLRSNPYLSSPQDFQPANQIWTPSGLTYHLCADINIFSSCDFGEKLSRDCFPDPCQSSECISYGAEALCRPVGCDNKCRAEWFYNGKVVTHSCSGCIDPKSKVSYGEGEIWESQDGCQRCQCLQGISRCSGCPPVSCSNPDVSSCCPVCTGCTYQNQTFPNGAEFQSSTNPCDRCLCRNGTVKCGPTTCPQLKNCKDPLTKEGSCCPICLSCADKRNGERWYQGDCTVCQCRHGVPSCTEVKCGKVPCSHPVTVPGVCCPQCKACSYQGSYYADGQTFSLDSCQTCVCKQGNVTCKVPACPALSCADSYRPPGSCCPICPDGCEYSGRKYDEGSVFTPSFNPCMNCSCANRKVRCGPVSCPPTPELKCSRPVALPGDCCPSFCPSCMFEGVEYNHGDRFKPSSNPCDVCLCHNGHVTCRSTANCERTCSYGVYEKGSCCSDCTDCMLNGQLYRDGTNFTSTSADGCSVCLCKDGNIRCSSRVSQCPPTDCSNPVQVQGSCCAECPKCENGRSHQERWRDERNPCQICECFDQSTRCYPQPCQGADGCLSAHLFDGECCPTCLDCVGDKSLRYRNGSTFEMVDKRCQLCTCINGDIKCNRLPCPSINCTDPVMLPDKCCPICIQRECDYKGRRVPEGFRFADGCNECNCRSGKVTCLVKSCPPITCSNPVMSECCPSCTDGCLWQGQKMQLGESRLEASRCANCTCVLGTVNCSPVQCPEVKCAYPIREGCCMSCGNGCYVNGTIIPEGTLISDAKGSCKTCHCRSGDIKCTDFACSKEKCSTPMAKNCCPICTSCSHNGRVYADGDSFSDDVKCRSCVCAAGDIRCSDFACSKEKCSMPMAKNCCPICSSCSHNGRVYVDGDSFSDDVECKSCDCSAGQILCKPKSCPSVTCTSPIRVDCCLTCIRGCQVNDILYREGDFIPSTNPCDECACMSGSVVCEKKICPQLPSYCLSPSRALDKCCPSCSGCFFSRGSGTGPDSRPLAYDDLHQLYRNLKIFKSGRLELNDNETYIDEGTCETCQCYAGEISCRPLTCPEVECSHPTRDTCCPMCDSCYFNSQVLQHGDVVNSEADPCSQCTCVKGNVKCSKTPCPSLDCIESSSAFDGCGCPLCSQCSLPHGNFTEGQSWLNSNNCQCTCENGEAKCQTCDGLSLPCLFTEPDASVCCGLKCKGCLVNGVKYSSGATWTSDRCEQTCSCIGGVVTCVENLTPNDRCIDYDQDCLISVPNVENCCQTPACKCQAPDGRELSLGQIFKVNSSSGDCSICTCVQSADFQMYLECHKPICPTVAGCPKEKMKMPDAGSCCSICEGMIEVDCQESNEGITTTSTFNPCEECRCSQGTWTCNTRTCPPITCPVSERLVEPGKCCPTCAGCYTADISKAHGSYWQHPVDPCATCKCNYGLVQCETTVLCPLLFCTEGRKPFTPEGECCQICGDLVTGDDCLDSRGKTRLHGSGWSIDDCTDCECWGGNVTCFSQTCPQDFKCLSDETLAIEEGVCCPKCVKQPAICKVYGDPHFKTFDGDTIHFQGFCSYEMVKLRESETFRIISVHDDRKTKSVSWLKSLIIQIGDLNIKLGQGLWSEINGVNVSFPFHHSSGIVVRQLPYAIEVTAEQLGVKITWDGFDYAEVEADAKLKNKLYGLCGNFNDDADDELTMKNGQVTSSHAQFGESWLVPNMECSAKANDDHPCDLAGYEIKKKAIEQCAVLQSKVFSGCHRAVKPDDYVYSCIYDMCACNGTEDCLCDILTAYSAACSKSFVNLQWRTTELCAMNCDERRGFVFDECGPVCPKTCDNYKLPIQQECLKPCQPSCQCPAGLLQHGGRCVMPQFCP